VLKASVGRAVRMPTVAELYGATSTTNSQFINDPNLRPERSWTSELSAETEFARRRWRGSPCSPSRPRMRSIRRRSSTTSANRNVSRVQNIELIRTRGIEAAFNGSDVGCAAST
jgi:iron complex outermembrane receptor protein